MRQAPAAALARRFADPGGRIAGMSGDSGLSRQLVGRSAGVLFVVSGAVNLVAIAQPVSGDNVLGELVVGLACLLIGESVAWVSARWRDAQDDLKEHEVEERLHALVQNASDVIAIVTPDAAIQ